MLAESRDRRSRAARSAVDIFGTAYWPSTPLMPLTVRVEVLSSGIDHSFAG